MNDPNTLPTDYFNSYRKSFYLFELSFNLFDNVNDNKGIKYVKNTVIGVGIILMTISHICFVVNVLTSGEDWMNHTSNTLAVLLYVEGYYNIYWFFKNKKRFQNLMYRLGDEWDFSMNKSKIAIKEKYLRVVNVTTDCFNYGALIALFLVFGSWIIKSLFDVYVIRSTNKFIFKYGLYLPFDASESVERFLFMSVIDAILINKIALLKIGLLMLLMIFLGHLATNFALVTDDFRRVFEINDEVEIEHRMCSLIKRHQKLIRYSEELNAAFSQILITTVMGTTLYICMFVFLVACSNDFTVNIVATFSTLVYMISFCWHGQRLSNASMELAEGVYNSSWNLTQSKHRKMILVILMRSQRPCHVSAINMMPANLDTFVRVVKIAYSFFSFTFKMVNKRD